MSPSDDIYSYNAYPVKSKNAQLSPTNCATPLSNVQCAMFFQLTVYIKLNVLEQYFRSNTVAVEGPH